MNKQEKMFSVVEAWKQSGLGGQKYAAQIGMPYATLQYWGKRYRDHQQQNTPMPARFVALEVPTEERSPSMVSGIVIILPSGVRIEVH
ncbi:MAG: hypothetical protein HYX66_05205 [Ignavibacteria bacterium]|nr:hypothetical protein [Ignavibacteria bacterium]